MPATSVVAGIAQLDAQRFDNKAEAHWALAAALKPLKPTAGAAHARAAEERITPPQCTIARTPAPKTLQVV